MAGVEGLCPSVFQRQSTFPVSASIAAVSPSKVFTYSVPSQKARRVLHVGAHATHPERLLGRNAEIDLVRARLRCGLPPNLVRHGPSTGSGGGTDSEGEVDGSVAAGSVTGSVAVSGSVVEGDTTVTPASSVSSAPPASPPRKTA